VQSSPMLESHVPSPHAAQVPQSGTHDAQLSPTLGSQTPSPHDAHTPQSAAHDEQSSPLPISQLPFPQVEHRPQSTTHDEQSSPAAPSHVPSPQPAHSPQSVTQLLQDSPLSASHVPLPQDAHSPQSVSQLVQLSVAPQVPSPQVAPRASWPGLDGLMLSPHAAARHARASAITNRIGPPEKVERGHGPHALFADCCSDGSTFARTGENLARRTVVAAASSTCSTGYARSRSSPSPRARSKILGRRRGT
jgi:hypothetical protein